MICSVPVVLLTHPCWTSGISWGACPRYPGAGSGFDVYGYLIGTYSQPG